MICYRQVDSWSVAKPIYQRLSEKFGEANVFMDLPSIKKGEDIKEKIENIITTCDVFVAVIGPNWLSVKDDEGDLRLQNPEDWIRIELSTALARDIRVIPFILPGAKMPKKDDLPDDLDNLADRNAIVTGSERFEEDLEALVEECNDVKEPLRTARRAKTQKTAAVLAAILVILAAIKLLPLLDKPSVTNQSVSLIEDQKHIINLSTTNPEIDYDIETSISPTNGLILVVGTQAHYTPFTNYYGADYFQYKVIEKSTQIVSAYGNVDLTVSPEQDLPTVQSTNLFSVEDHPVEILLAATDPDNEPIEFHIETAPHAGKLLSLDTLPRLVYLPNTNFTGKDFFEVRVSDSLTTSAPARINILIDAKNDPPIARSLAASIGNTGTAREITLEGFDVDGDQITYALADQPTHGRLTGRPPKIEYKPNPDFRGEDSFSFTVNDGSLSSPPAMVTVTVTDPQSAKLSARCQSASERAIGRPIEYCVTISNDGDIESEPVELSIALPPGTKFGSASEGGTATGNRILWDGKRIPAHSHAEYCANIVGTNFGTHTFRYVVQSTDDGEKIASGEGSTKVYGIPTVRLDLHDIEDPVEVGSTETYEITVTNEGSGPDTNLRIRCNLSRYQEFVSAGGTTSGHLDGNQVIFDALPTLGVGARASWTVVMKALSEGDARFKVEMMTDTTKTPLNASEATNQY